MNTSYIFRIMIACALFLVLGNEVSAQVVSNSSIPRIYAEVSPAVVSAGSEVTLRIFIDSQKPINALETKLTYSASLLQATVFNESASVIQLWQDKDIKTTPGTIVLSGGIPRAFAGNKGEIGKVTFKALKVGTSQITFSIADMYYADGLGTRLAAQKVPVQIVIRPQASSPSTTSQTPGSVSETASEVSKDTDPPVFGLTDTLRNPSKGNHLAIFEVKDAGSGIAKVEMRTNSLIYWTDWREVTNPAEVVAGTLTYELRATDNAGNVASETLYVRSKLFILLTIVILSFAFLAGAIYFIIKR